MNKYEVLKSIFGYYFIQAWTGRDYRGCHNREDVLAMLPTGAGKITLLPIARLYTSRDCINRFTAHFLNAGSS